MTDILMPALSPTMEEGTLAKWTVKVGDTVKSGDVIAEIETDKATMEVEAVDEGVVGELLVPEGSEGVKVNAVIARLRGDGEGGTPAPSEASAQTSEPARLDETAEPENGARAAREGSADETREAKVQGDKAERSPAPAPNVGNEPPQSAASRPTAPPQGGERGSGDPSLSRPGGGVAGAAGDEGGAQRIFASPLARRLAQQKGIALSALKGSGPHGRIVKADVDAAQPAAKSQPPQVQPTPGAAQTAPAEAPRQARSLEQMGIAPGSYDLKPLDSMKRTIARRMTESARDIPHFPLTIDIELDALMAARVALNKRLDATGVKVSVNDILIKCAALALKAQPDANASYTPEGIASHHHADVAVAVAIDGGLITPIVREAETRGLADIARTMKDLAERARARKLKPEEYQGGTFSISNLGMFGIKSFSSIINEPQGMILSVGAGEKRPVVRGDQLAVATVMTVTLTCDHRVVDGAIGARWLAAFRGFVEDPITMLA